MTHAILSKSLRVGIALLILTLYLPTAISAILLQSESTEIKCNVIPDLLHAKASVGHAMAPSLCFDIITGTQTGVYYRADTRADWIILSDTVGRAPARVKIEFDKAGLAPGFYLDSIEVTIGEDGDNRFHVKVGLEITTCYETGYSSVEHARSSPWSAEYDCGILELKDFLKKDTLNHEVASEAWGLLAAVSYCALQGGDTTVTADSVIKAGKMAYKSRFLEAGSISLAKLECLKQTVDKFEISNAEYYDWMQISRQMACAEIERGQDGGTWWRKWWALTGGGLLVGGVVVAILTSGGTNGPPPINSLPLPPDHP